MFTKKQVLENLKAAGVEIDAPAMAYYLKLGIVEPAEDAEGRGKVKRHSPWNQAEIGIARTLEGYGLRLAAVKPVMDQLRDLIRREIKRGKIGAYRFQLIIKNPNGGETQEVRFQKSLTEEIQRRNWTREPFPPGRVVLNMDQAGAFLVIDITELLKKLAAHF